MRDNDYMGTAIRQDALHVRGSECPTEPTRHGNPKQVFLRGGVLPHTTQVAVASYDTLMETELHSHPTMFEVYYALEGLALYTVGDQEFTIQPGDFLIVPPATVHKQKILQAPHKIFYWGIATD